MRRSFQFALISLKTQADAVEDIGVPLKSIRHQFLVAQSLRVLLMLTKLSVAGSATIGDEK